LAARLLEIDTEGAMSTVGISFGSPTSGAGFDVSTTVSSIVANLQNVETPWKTQLTSLESQDTAISSLGTLYSNLSNAMSTLTDATGIMAEKMGSSSNNNVLELTTASSSAVAGTHTVVVTSLAQTSSGYLTAMSNSSDTLSGSISIAVGSGTAQTVTLDSTDNTLSGLASAINSAGIGVTASVLTDSSGSRLSLVSGTSGASGNLTVSSSITDTTNSGASLAYKSSATGADAALTVDGIDLTSASNTVANLIPGVTFQLLSDAPSTQVQVVIGNDNSDVESTIATVVNDYNSLVSAINTQEGNDSSGNAEPLFGSPTLSLLQQQLLGGLNTQNPNGYLDAITKASDTLTGSISIQVSGGFLLDSVTTAGADATTGTDATDATSSTSTLAAIANASDTLSGSISIQVGTGTAQTVSVPSTGNTLAGLAKAINDTTGIGVTASVVTNSDGSSSLSLLSGTSGTAGSLTVTSSIQDTSSQTVSVPATSEDSTLAGLASAINSASIGVTASVVTNSSGSQLVLTSGTSGSSGALKVTSAIVDTTNSDTALKYTSSSDINSLSSLGISVNNDGSISLDATSLDSVLNSDYSSVVGFFQNVNSWGLSFSTMLTNAGTSSSTGILSLASSSNSSIESTLNDDISKEEALISAESKSLTTELNSANEVLQEIPMELSQVNELYSAITGYNQNS
jgi:flagellar hook-associated protein 2